MEIRRVAVFCSSSDAIDEIYVNGARKLGRIIGEHGWEMIFGGASVGLMGHLAETVKAAGGRSIGVVPEMLVARGIASEHVEEMIVTPDMKTRKATIAAKADAFIALPGSIGTMEEMLEQAVLKSLKQHAKPIVVVNLEGYYERLFELFDEMIEKRFIKMDVLRVFKVVERVEQVPEYLATYQPPALPNKWFGKDEV
ncbi:TIGR00730 family Rossman fold protein [bacterium]|nr:TIGR00730 family Rossman fold protein [bacterium]